MRLGFTGTRNVPSDKYDKVYSFLSKQVLPTCPEFTTGACNGFDAMAARWLLANRPLAIHRLAVPANRSQVDIDLYHEFLTASIPGHTIIELMPDGTDYRFRNEHIVARSDLLVAVCEYPEDHPKSKRSGSWMTVRIARKQSVPVIGLVLQES